MKSALLVIDIQHLPVEGKPYGIENRLRLWQDSLAQARQVGLEVIHVRHHDQELIKGTADWEIHSTVATLASEKIFDKTFNSAFKETGLHAYLQEKEIEQLIIMGMATNFCIDTMIKVAFELGYKVAVIQDGTTPGYSGKLDAKDLIDHYQNIWSWNFAQVDKLENIIRG
ncbi:cysteine hydrolase family protein [Streptococcus suis]|uniref:cysteine hydrolase family protein n=1 Tax=Streptococcus suis TaxID=1307 RepID=UPI000CF589F1|nr:cysteine hydrolase family protein [Streptococcus suis]HEL1985774.1 cysteine hydrolase [Streptococcus suis]HEL9643068.1 cysteine hydrolase [Streptococcus suis]HEM4694754.1 cysteine hydrolase [Streptococcus suis]HEM4858714.1 cysteine hydrolase [Streptococcus suis]HEM4896984.1 cysteine hydrolase [Streptococcus suis]